MNFVFTPEQAMIAETARAFFAANATSERTRAAMATGADAELWRGLADLGLTSIAIPQAFGGSGLGAVELAIVCEAAGARVAALPLIATLGLAAPALIAGGSEAQKAEWLPKIAAGLPVAFGDDLIAHGDVAEMLLLTRGDSVALVERSAVTLETPVTMDQTRPLARVVRAGPGDALADGVSAMRAARRVGALAVAADALGGAQACLDRTVAYARERIQFGRAIGSFQAVKHRLADLMVAIEQARSAVWWAACAIDEDDAEAALAVHAAKAAACDAYSDAAAAMIQLHGGIGFTWEHDAHLFFKRARANRTLLGTPDWHREQIARLIGLDRAA